MNNEITVKLVLSPLNLGYPELGYFAKQWWNLDFGNYLFILSLQIVGISETHGAQFEMILMNM